MLAQCGHHTLNKILIDQKKCNVSCLDLSWRTIHAQQYFGYTRETPTAKSITQQIKFQYHPTLQDYRQHRWQEQKGYRDMAPIKFKASEKECNFPIENYFSLAKWPTHFQYLPPAVIDSLINILSDEQIPHLLLL